MHAALSMEGWLELPIESVSGIPGDFQDKPSWQFVIMQLLEAYSATAPAPFPSPARNHAPHLLLVCRILLPELADQPALPVQWAQEEIDRGQKEDRQHGSYGGQKEMYIVIVIHDVIYDVM